ncbi:alpha/beta fold hydrolase [Chitinimonas lacunae]|uniref:Alpha/beta fold hydrolase n=1 Tax=Chitinimonas lacunae TaxID=1963018 RepID=A0ABV8MMJ8_9NEIS
MHPTTPLVMIHGLLGSISYFSPAARLPELAVYTPDLLGYGRHSGCSEVLTLQRQAHHVASYIRTQVGRPCHLLGHSVGGAVAMLLAWLEPGLVQSVISVEGNLTLNDAFWCRRIAPLEESEWAAEYREMQAHPENWLIDAEIDPNPQRIGWARRILDNQPASTVQAMARAVVSETVDLLDPVKALVDRGLPIRLLAGEKSAVGWDVPPWLREAASADMVLPGVGHMMMLEQPDRFCATVEAMLGDR